MEHKLQPKKPIILIEFNELSSSVIDDLIAKGQLPNFSKFREESSVYSTTTTLDGYDLEPWIQWVTLHTGVRESVHGMKKLGDNKHLSVPTLGQLLQDQGLAVGIFSSMNLRHVIKNGYCIPDPWDPDGLTAPSSLQTYYDIISSQVKESSKEKLPTFSQSIGLIFFLLRNGLTFSTMSRAAKQLILEIFDKKIKWRRASILDQLNYDLARRLHQTYQPQFATFFSNSTAHYQHYFWHNFQPALFPDREDIDTEKANAVLFGYKNMDFLLGRFMSDYPNATLILCTALSQQPWTNTRKKTYRPKSFDSFLDFAGVNKGTAHVTPIMAEEFRIQFDSDGARKVAYSKLKALEFSGSQLMKIQETQGALLCGCSVFEEVKTDALCSNVEGETVAFGNLFYPIPGVRSGRHSPEGLLWIRDFGAKSQKEPLELTEIAPSILNYFDVRPLASMPEPAFRIAASAK